MTRSGHSRINHLAGFLDQSILVAVAKGTIQVMAYRRNRQHIYYYLRNDNAPGLAEHLGIDVDRAQALLDVAYDRFDAMKERGLLSEVEQRKAFNTALQRRPEPLNDRLWGLAEFLDASSPED